MYIQSETDLRALLGFPKDRAKNKQLDELEKHSIHFIRLSPFLTLSSHDASGHVDCSPRGGKPGFVKVINNKCILIPESKGNNRLDSLLNLLATGNIGCLFLIPGVDETLRINGTARISTSTEHLALFTEERNPPKVCIEITITEVFLHCAKSLMRSELWSIDSQIERSSLPTMGIMINEQLAVTDIPESQNEMLKRYKKDL
ncbi:pyridoxamine 5'-phosphate oxidase family protein [Marinomonas transparens]|uniref:Pyridoxamine 5'-phosphate oxidase family protein n=1 Tax=Marinomonas transparens TaxID=2795388 RepID=A0A934JS68_9GAMM|nr:pyridoxamine 5'-phosphate oxidase family protein [Marinomonas transparens]MBJ7537321.1 pyridoxamine 5'-phosphate oxidase family protein [Marinomonas transparens]